MRARFVGNGTGPRPNEIVQVMLGDHNVRISYWKTWRSREVAKEYAKGSSGSSYNLLPDYLIDLFLQIEAHLQKYILKTIQPLAIYSNICSSQLAHLLVGLNTCAMSSL